jgi:hypothetical protein
MAAQAGAQDDIAQAVLGALEAAVEAGGVDGARRWVPELVELWGG